jgi:4-amino-4-deoxy-L-arabinose transferase-like glycosyltransferase
MRVYQQATWVWVAMFGVRALVQGYLYTKGDAATLGFVNLVLGLPLFGLAVALTWLIVRRVPPARAEEPAAEPGAGTPAAAPDTGVSGGSARG